MADPGVATGEGPAIRLKGVTKRYGKVTAVEGLDLEVRRGEVFGFLGPNGAGKTTTLRMLLDLIRPTAGQVEVLGLDPRRDGPRLRRRIGYLSGEPALYGNWTGQRHLDLVAGLRGGQPDTKVEELARRLACRLDMPVQELSHGNRQKVALVAAMGTDPELLLLDEPTQGLDPLAREAVHDLVREARRRGITVFLSSHDLHEVQEVCDRVALIREGRLVAVAGIREMLASQPRRVQASLSRVPELAALQGIPGVTQVELQGRFVRARVMPPLAPFLEALRAYGIHDLVSQPPDLEDLFLTSYRGLGHV
ncbi:MAG: ABC transporter ATP-binding protein [Candidatus Thermoplasmatota archaeon]